MYPVLSFLRRAAASIILVTPDMLDLRKDGSYIRLNTRSQTLDRDKGKWGKTVDEFSVLQTTVEAEDSVAVAISMAKYENKLALMFNAEDSLYTLVIGPEDEEETGDGRVRRHSRYAIVRGVYRASAGVLEPIPQKGRAVVKFSPLPPGTVRE